MKVKFVIPGPCVAKARPRFSNKTGRVYTPNNTHKYEKLVKECYDNKYFFDDDFIEINITIKVEVPKSYGKQKREDALNGKIYPTKGDLDNFVKTITDGLNGTAFKDDRYIFGINAKKIFAEEAETIVEINSMKTN